MRALLFLILIVALPAVAEEPPVLVPTERTGVCQGTVLDLEGVPEELAQGLAGFQALAEVPLEFTWKLAPSGDEGVLQDLTFPSPRPTGNAAVDTVWCRYYPPSLSPGAGPAPAALVLHHLGGSFAVEAMLSAYLAAGGVHVLEVEFPYYGPRKPADEDHADRILQGDITTWPAPIQQAVADIRRATDWLRSRPDVDPERVGVVGVSLGGIIGSLAAGVDPRLRRNVLVIAGGDLPAIIRHDSRETREARARLQADGISAEQLTELLRPIEPLRYAGRIHGEGTLLLAASEDEVIPRPCTEALAQAIGDAEVVWYPAGHYSMAGHLLDLFDRIRTHYQRPTPPPVEPDPEDDEFF